MTCTTSPISPAITRLPYLVNNNTSSSIEISTATNYYMYETGDTLKVKLVFDYGFVVQYGYVPTDAPTVTIRIGSSSTVYTLTYKSISYGSIVNDDDYSNYQVAFTYEMSQTITSSMKGMVIINSISCSETLVDIAGNVIDFDSALESEATNIKVNMAVAKIAADGTAFESLTSALASITSSTEKEILMVGNTTECVTISASRNITIELNGKTITCATASTGTVTVLGSLTIKDTSTGGTIKSTGSSAYGVRVKSAGTLTVQSGTINATGTGSYGILIAYEAGTKIVTISGGTIGGVSYGIANKGGILNFEGGTINKGSTGILLENSYTVNMTGGEITYSSGTYGIYGAGTIKVANATLTGAAYGIRITSGTLNITNSTITADTYGVQMSGGTATIKTGTITGGTAGVYMSGETLTFGVTGGDVSKETPLITGSSYGLTKTSGTINLYDGMFRGVTSACYNGTSAVDCSTVIDVIETGDDYFIKNDTVDGYKRAYLAIIRAQACGIYHDSIQSAIDCATDGVNETVVMLRDTTENPIVPSGKIITLDLNGFIVTGGSDGSTIFNQGQLTIITSVADGKITSTIPSNGTIENEGTLTINDFTNGSVTYSPIIEIAKETGVAIYSSSGELYIYGGIIQDLNGTYTVSIGVGGGIATISGGTITSSNIAIANSGSNATITISGGTITGDNYGIENVGTMFVNGGTISGNVGISNEGIASITSGNVTGTSLGVQNEGELTVSGGTIKSIENIGGSSVITGGTITTLKVTDGTALVSGGTIGSSSTANTVTVSGGTLTVTGGTISSSNYGIYNTSGTIVLGASDGVVSKTTPVILSRGIGVYSEAVALKFYDGIVKAITGVCANASGIVDCTAILPLKTDAEMTELEKIDAAKGIPIYSVEAGYYVKSSTEGAYKTAFLSMAVAYACDKYFDSVQEAIDCAKNESLAGLSYSPNEFEVQPTMNNYSIINKIEYVSIIVDNKNLKGWYYETVS